MLWRAVLLCAAAVADDRPAPLAQRASWKTPSLDEVRQQVFDWLAEAGAGDEQRTRSRRYGTAPLVAATRPTLLDLTCATFALVDPQARELVEFCSRLGSRSRCPTPLGWSEEATPPMMRHNLRLLYGRWLVQ